MLPHPPLRFGPVSLTTRERILEATYTCVSRWGLAKTTVEDVAREAGLSRATVYRHFPGGRDQLEREVVAWEAARFFGSLAEAVAGAPDLPTLVERALVWSHREIREHAVLQKVLETEPGRLLPLLTVESTRLLRLVQAFVRPYLDSPGVRPGIDRDEAAEYLARMLLSHVTAAGGRDLDDPGEVRRLVREELLAPIVTGDT